MQSVVGNATDGQNTSESRVLTADFWWDGASRLENAKSRFECYYGKIGSYSELDAAAFKLPGGCFISMFSGGHHAEFSLGHKSYCNPLLVFGYG